MSSVSHLLVLLLSNLENFDDSDFSTWLLFENWWLIFYGDSEGKLGDFRLRVELKSSFLDEDLESFKFLLFTVLYIACAYISFISE